MVLQVAAHLIPAVHCINVNGTVKIDSSNNWDQNTNTGKKRSVKTVIIFHQFDNK